jgi:hypothetical protein
MSLENLLKYTETLRSPEESQLESFDSIAKRAREGKPIPLRETTALGKPEPLITLSASDDLAKAMEHFGSGVHRILICKDGTTDVVGVLSQLRLVKFMSDNATSFASIDALNPLLLKDLAIGAPSTIGIK